MQINVPRLGDTLILDQDWNALVYDEYRNTGFLENLLELKNYTDYNDRRRVLNQFYGVEDTPTYYRHTEPALVPIPAGTNLVVERIYIRKGATDYDSITFRIPKGGCPMNKNMVGRFWVKIDNANQLIYHTV